MKKNTTYEELEEKARRTDNELTNPIMQPIDTGTPAVQTPGIDVNARRPSLADRIFGEDTATARAREARNATFQDMLNSRKQAAVQQRTDDATMARYNALGNLITTMVQPVGWGIGGGFSGGTTGGVQKYDDRQYISAFNRAVKAADDLRNIGSAEQEYRFKLADEDYRRQLALEDAERQQERMLERQERAAQEREERDRRKYEHDIEMQERKAASAQQLAEWKATHRVTSKGTGLSVDDRMMLKNLDAYNKQANEDVAYGRTPITFEKWLDQRGYDVSAVRTAGGGQSTGSSKAVAGNGTNTDAQTQTQQEVVPGVTPGWSVMGGGGLMYNPSGTTGVSSSAPASSGAPVVFNFNSKSKE